MNDTVKNCIGNRGVREQVLPFFFRVWELTFCTQCVPQSALRADIGEIAADQAKEFKKTSALRTWGWMCIADSQVEEMLIQVAEGFAF